MTCPEAATGQAQAADVWRTGGLPMLAMAGFCASARSLGPGARAVVWVQGCPFACPGCIAPDWIPQGAAQPIVPERLAALILSGPKLDGVTFSGGEPMRQAAGLAETIRLVRRERDLSLICFTGYRRERLHRDPPGPGVAALLQATDLLIDGLYDARRDDGRGLRGSSNQRLHALTDRFDAAALATLRDGPRHVELHVEDDGLLLVGVPDPATLNYFAEIAEATDLR
jgi:anaerobic ribonucleoside-triphosphate reductase activating protein